MHRSIGKCKGVWVNAYECRSVCVSEGGGMLVLIRAFKCSSVGRVLFVLLYMV